MKNKIILLLLLTFFCTACSPTRYFETQDGPPSRVNIDVSKVSNATPKAEVKSRFGNPSSYVVNGQRYYVLKSSKGFDETGIASWYGTKFNHQLTSDREYYDMMKMTAANKTLPLPTFVRVTNLKNGRQIIVKVNDRGPFEKNRLIDLSYVAAAKLGILKQGTGLVRVTAIHAFTPKAQHLPTPAPTTHLASVSTKPMIFLQVGAYSDHQHAEQMLTRVNTVTTLPTHIYASGTATHKLYRVQIGPIGDVETSDFLVSALEEADIRHPKTVIKEGHA